MSDSPNRQRFRRYDWTNSYFHFVVIATVGALPIGTLFYFGATENWIPFLAYVFGHYWTYRLGWKYSEHGPNFNFQDKWPSEDEISNAAILFLLVSYIWPLLLVYWLGLWVLTLITGKRARFDYDSRSDLEKLEDNRDPYERWFSETVKKQKEKETRNEK